MSSNPLQTTRCSRHNADVLRDVDAKFETPQDVTPWLYSAARESYTLYIDSRDRGKHGSQYIESSQFSDGGTPWYNINLGGTKEFPEV